MAERKWASFRDEEAAEVLREWWTGLEAARGDRAQLRRCRQLGEVFFTPAFHRLFRRLEPLGFRDREGLAAVAALASHLKPASKGIHQPFGERLATPAREGANPMLSDLRFRRLLQCKGRDELFPALVRTLHLLGDEANLIDLAEGVYRWSWPSQPTQKQWAFDYYEKLEGLKK